MVYLADSHKIKHSKIAVIHLHSTDLVSNNNSAYNEELPYKWFFPRGAIFANFADLPVIREKYNLENESTINNNATPYYIHVIDNCVKPRP